MKKSEFLKALSRATYDAKDLKSRGRPIYISIRKYDLLPGKDWTAITSDDQLQRNAVFRAVDSGASSAGQLYPYAQLALAEAAWEAYEESARAERVRADWEATRD